jgi:predicted alpha/beta hydrolase family esterase
VKTPVLFVQGAGEGAHDVDAHLVESLTNELGSQYEIHYPLMPAEASPNDAEWKDCLMKEVARLGNGAILVAHSAGASALVRTLAERPVTTPLGGIFLIAAPFCGGGGWQIEGCTTPADLGDRLPVGVPVFLYHGRDDEVVPFAHVALYANALPRAVVRRLSGRGHQLDNDLSVVAADIKRVGIRPV